MMKMCANCYSGEVHHSIGMITYVKCIKDDNKHPEKPKSHEQGKEMVLPALLDLECWEPKKE